MVGRHLRTFHKRAQIGSTPIRAIKMNTIREQFRQDVFHRDNYKCVICKNTGVDAHHILERRLFIDGGYHVNNGATVCSTCHLLCESTDISVEDVRHAAGITKKYLPEHLYDDEIYDKWGNIILPNETRLKGELFYDESVQKILADKLHLFVDLVKYPRTHHLPWSPGMHEDDRMIPTLDYMKDSHIVITEKLDGENTSMYRNDIHARSVTSNNHHSRNWVKNFWSSISHDIPDGWRICGENLYAKHSIEYSSLKSYFYGFSIWNEKNECLSWNDTLEWFNLLGITPVPILYEGPFNRQIFTDIESRLDFRSQEGYVCRVREKFPYSRFRMCVGKFVRTDHVKTVNHWMFGKPIQNNILEVI